MSSSNSSLVGGQILLNASATDKTFMMCEPMIKVGAMVKPNINKSISLTLALNVDVIHPRSAP